MQINYYRVKEAAAILNIEGGTLRNYISNGRIKAKRIGGMVCVSNFEICRYLLKKRKYERRGKR